MPVETTQLFFALLALALGAFVVVGTVGLIVARSATMVALKNVRTVALEMAAAIAVTCTLGSLYLSEIVGYIPCRLCWIQRFFMYPAAALLLVAVVTRRRVFVGIAAGLAAVGLPVSIFHRVEQAVGGFGEALCDPNNPCSGIWIDEFGFMTIPTMAAIGFAGIMFFAGLSLRSGSLSQSAA